jgi:hypothetical protein
MRRTHSASCAGPEKARILDSDYWLLSSFNFWVIVARGSHPFPSRTRKLSPSAPMVLHAQVCGRVGRCPIKKRSPGADRGFFISIRIPDPYFDRKSNLGRLPLLPHLQSSTGWAIYLLRRLRVGQLPELSV